LTKLWSLQYATTLRIQILLIGELRGECVKKLRKTYVICLNDIVVDEIDN